jgi:hypothetical protein
MYERDIQKHENRVKEKKAKSGLLPARFRMSRVEHSFI